MKIAFVVHEYHAHGGHSRYVWELARRFAAAHEVHVFASRFEPDERIHFHYVPSWRASALTTIVTFILPATLLVGRKFDIIHSQGLCGLRQDVATAHICLQAWYEAQARQTSLTWKQRLFRRLVVPLERLIFQPRRSPRVIVISRKVQEELARCYGRSDHVTLIYHGVDLETFNPRQRVVWRERLRSEMGLAEHDCLALYVGDLQKGARAAIEAVARVPGVRLLCVSPSKVGPYQQRVQELGIADRVHFRPLTPAIEGCYAAADLLLHPTFYDAYGMVVSEAMASGLPVITTRAAGVAELVEHDQDGLLTDSPVEIEALAVNLQRLASDPGLRTRLGEAARRKFENYTWDAAADATMKVYQGLIEESTPAIWRQGRALP